MAISVPPDGRKRAKKMAKGGKKNDHKRHPRWSETYPKNGNSVKLEGIRKYGQTKKVRKPFNFIFYATRNMQVAIRNTQYPIRNMQYAILNTQYSIRNTQYAIRNNMSCGEIVSYLIHSSSKTRRFDLHSSFVAPSLLLRCSFVRDPLLFALNFVSLMRICNATQNHLDMLWNFPYDELKIKKNLNLRKSCKSASSACYFFLGHRILTN